MKENQKPKYSSETEYRRSLNDGKEGRFYTKISNSLSTNNKIGMIHMGIMQFILMQSDDFVITKAYIFKLAQRESAHSRIKIGKVLFDKAWSDLIHEGYLEKVRIKGGVKWIIIETPTKLES